jgi:hypothetical protein
MDQMDVAFSITQRMMQNPAVANHQINRSTSNIKNFRFSSDVEVFRIPNRGDITMDEIQSCNFSEKEFGEIRQRERRLARQLSRLGAVIDVGEDELGLESSQTKSRRKARRQEGQMSVLLEQTLQNDVNHYDTEYLAITYALYTKESATLAYDRGLRVAEHVKIMTFCDSSSDLSLQAGQQHQHMVRSSRWRSPACARAPLATMAYNGARQIQQQHYQQKYQEHVRSPHPWEQWAKKFPCDVKETIQIRSRWFGVV